MKKLKFKNTDKAIEWLFKSDKPDEFEFNANIKHWIQYNDSRMEFSTDKALKEWIQENYDKIHGVYNEI
jgi:hypothetical protein